MHLQVRDAAFFFFESESRCGNGPRPARATDMATTTASRPRVPQRALTEAWSEYLVDSVERAVLFWDVLRKHGNTFVENTERGEPPVLIFDHEVIIDSTDALALPAVPGRRSTPRSHPQPRQRPASSPPPW